MFRAARWRLTVSFTIALGVILVVTGLAVYFTTRAALYDQVDNDLVSRAGREQRMLAPRLPGLRHDPPFADFIIGPRFAAAGYFYALVRPDGEVIVSTANADPVGLADIGTLREALGGGGAFADTESSEGDSLRVHVVSLRGPGGERLLMEVGRSTEPEQQALRRLLLVLVGGLGGGLVLAVAGGYFLSGRVLRPIGAALDSQRAFIGDASHELRTPLSVIRANAELLKGHPSEPVSTSHEAVDNIIAESDRLGKLVGQMLTLAQVDAGQARLRMSEVALDETAEEVARGMRVLAEARGVLLETDLDSPVRLKGDGDRLRELLVVLTDNAIKYTDATGHVRLEVRRLSGGRARVRVSDSGRGIPAEALPHIFDRFYRVDRARSREAGGAGLGLAIARWIAEAHGGSIRAESAPGVGTTITVELAS